MYGGRLFGLPMSAEAVALIYNRALVAEPPTTWEELLELAQAQMEMGNFGFMYTFADPYFNAGWFHAYGARVFGETEDGGLDPNVILLGGEPGYQAGRFIQELRWTYNLVPEGTDYEVANSAFIQGVLAMIINGPWALGDYRGAGIDFGIAPVPAPPGAPEPWQPFIGVHGVAVNAYSPAARKEAAVAFAKQLASPESLFAFNRAAGRIPVSEAALAELGDDAVVQGFSEVIAVGIPMPNIPEMGRVWAPWGNAIELIGQSPTADVEAIIDDMVAQIAR
jgi:arabinogalactan oligomer/maltooligosaccharide transport system substrate-binding protein